MTDEAMTAADWDNANFAEACRRLPPALPCFSNGACCPWCGALHSVVTFGGNECESCARRFCFGFPPWGERIPERPETFVNFPVKEWHAMGARAGMIPVFEPTDALREQWAAVEAMIAEAEGRVIPAPGGVQ